MHAAETDYSVLAYQLPQTRIFCTEYETPHALRFVFIEYFQSCLLIIKNENPGSVKGLAMEWPAEEPFFCSAITKKTGQNLFSLSFKSLAFLWLRPGSEYRRLDETPAWLASSISKEYVQHPFHLTRARDKALMNETDRQWACLDFMDESGEVVSAEPGKIDSAMLLLAGEIFSHLGKEKIFNQFLKKAYGMPYLSGLPAFAEEKGENDKLLFFLNTLLQGDKISRQTELLVQQYWEYVGQPFLELYLAQVTVKRTEGLLAFALLALYGNFWWFPSLYEKIIPALPEKTRRLFSFLLQLKRMVVFRKHSRGFTANPPLRGALEGSLENPGKDFQFSYNCRGKKEYTHLTLGKSLQFRIDKKAVLDYLDAEKILTAEPLLAAPPLTALSSEKVKILLDGFTLQIPLAWPSFEVTLNKVRIRFLQKKERFQLTFRQRKDFPAILLNGRELVFAKDLKLKIIVQLLRKESRLEIYPYTLSGIRLKAAPIKNSLLRFSGIASDSFGLLRNNLQISFNDSGYSKAIQANDNAENIFQASFPMTGYRLTARRCRPAEYVLSEADELYQRMKNTPAHLLRNQIMLFFMEDSRVAQADAITRFREKFAFYPETDSFENFNRQPAKYSIVFGKKQPGVLLADGDLYKIIGLKNRKVIFVFTEKIPEFFRKQEDF